MFNSNWSLVFEDLFGLKQYSVLFHATCDSYYVFWVVASHEGTNQSFEGRRRKPDEDAFKLFVGQIPYDTTEDELMEVFEEYGSIYQLKLLKQSVSRGSRGK